MRNDPSLQRLIPLTSLRHFYCTLRRFVSEEFHRQAANECLRRPDQLAEMIIESRRHFSLYDNRNEPFHRRSGPTEAVLSNRYLANTLVQRMSESGVAVGASPNFDFTFVDYSISPVRTTRSEFENGVTGLSSGRGGVDLLLSNRRDRTPIIGEIKADTDQNPFFGLIQSLTYAVELSTDPQRTRLEQSYPNRFASNDLSPWVDIYLLLLRYPDDAKSREFLNMTDKIASQLMAKENPVARIIRRIVALESPMEEGQPCQFNVRFVHGLSD